MKPTKYRSRKTAYNGQLYDSKKEARYAAKLDLLLKSGIVTEIKRQVPFKWETIYRANGKELVSNQFRYVVDFVVTYSTGEIEYIDVKGFKTADYKRKKKIMKALFDIDIVER